MMQLVEQHIISKADSRYEAIDATAFASKNLYNLANYHMRQSFIHTGKYLGYAEVYHLVKHEPAYQALPRKVSNDVLRLLDKNWKAFRKAMEAYYEDSSQFLGRPCLPKYKDNTNRMERMTIKRTRRIDHYLHVASKRIIALLVAEGIGTLIVGKNPFWKQEAEMRKKDKQHFVQLPHARFIDMLCYKAKLVGIQVIVQEESYTSKASFLDSDPIPTYGKMAQEPKFSGRRVKRGLYRASGNRYLNADVNGSYNIMRKASPNAFGNGVEAVAVQPGRLTVSTGGHLS